MQGESGEAGFLGHFVEGTITIIAVEEDRLTVLFDDVGYKTLSTGAVTASGVLRTAGASAA